MYRLMTLRGVIHGGTGRHEKNKSDKKKKSETKENKTEKDTYWEAIRISIHT